ncbi:MAG: HAMP domain-containing protein [Candidatus Rokubacteria bacterium]|nr:HAMP domain-containing protein [Candidatus Rokubacteria bacterium]
MTALPPLIFLVNIAVTGVLMMYSSLNLRPDLPASASAHQETYHRATLYLAILLPTAASAVYLWPVSRWVRRVWVKCTAEGGTVAVPPPIGQRAANAPITLAAFSLASWILVDLLVLLRLRAIPAELTPGLAAHFIIRPLLAGLIAGVAVFFVSEYVCRTHLWPALLATVPIAGNPGVWRIRLAHRLLLLWLAIGFLPLSAVALTASMRVDHPDAADAVVVRVVSVVIFIAASAALGGAGLAWLLARSMDRPLRALEQAMARLRGGDFSVREPVRTTDEIGGLAEGFNLMAERLSESYAALETRNRELAAALDRVTFLESVKRGLDRFVPDTVRRALEENPDATALQKRTRDVTVLFLDIEGYTRLSEELPREALTALLERYFSLFLSDIRAEGGDINETAGDGLMILFQADRPEAHALAAVRAALAIRDKTEVTNRAGGDAHPSIAVNIGIGSGECDLGVVRLHGAAGERWTYTATGPVTNLAARLGDRAVGGQILVSAETAGRVRGAFRLMSLGPLALKNILSPVEAWEVEPTSLQPNDPSPRRVMKE